MERGGGVMLGALSHGPLVSGWVVYPLAALTMTVIAAHGAGLSGAAMPESRRKIRRINGMLMLVATAVLAYAFGGAGSDRPGEFVVVWMASILLLGIIVLVAFVDILNTARLHRVERRELRRQIQDARARLAEFAAESARARRDRSQSPDRGR